MSVAPPPDRPTDRLAFVEPLDKSPLHAPVVNGIPLKVFRQGIDRFYDDVIHLREEKLFGQNARAAMLSFNLTVILMLMISAG